ncbi:MAG: BamA/TamA family outer membrane protein [Cyclobacteriaceae bacterium]
MRYLHNLAVFSIFLTSCIGASYLKKGESVYAQQAKIKGSPNSLTPELEKLIDQQPNSRFISHRIPITPRVHAYQLGKKLFDSASVIQKKGMVSEKFDQKISTSQKDRKKEKLVVKRTKKIDRLDQQLIEGNWLMRVGEPLAVFDSMKHLSSLDKMERFLNSEGYFHSKVGVTFDFPSKQTTSATYDVALAEPYTVDSIDYKSADSLILNILLNHHKNTELQLNKPYQQKQYEAERNRIYQLLQDNGFYGFSRQFIHFNLDSSTLGQKRIFVQTEIAIPVSGTHRQFKIDSVIFTSDVGDNKPQLYTTVPFSNITYRFGANRYSPQILDWRILIQKDSLYNRSATQDTQRQLSYLDAFKFVNINYDSIGTEGLIANVFTSPLSKYQTSYEMGFVQAPSNIPGPFINLGLKRRNAFGGLESISLNGNFSILGISDVTNIGNNYSQFEYGGSLSFDFPKILFPASDRVKQNINLFNPTSKITLSYFYEDRRDDYERSRTNLGMTYIWRVGEAKQFSLSPITFSLTDVNQLSIPFKRFLADQEARGNGALKAAFNSSVTSSINFNMLFNGNQYGNTNINSSYKRMLIESGGFLGQLIGENFFQERNFSFFQWVKFEVDLRKMLIIPNRGQLSLRFHGGLAHTYGIPDPTLPYEKRFYAGGSNSMRAWQVRRIGPGSLSATNQPVSEEYPVAIINYQLEQGGDMALEANIEYRRNLIGFLDYAIFADFGNIWILNSAYNTEDLGQGNVKFKFDSFLKEIGAGVGAGLRFDFTYLVFRLDGAVQVIDPAQPAGNRFILDDLNLLTPFSKSGRNSPDMEIFRNKTNLSIGIGLPF